MHGFYRIAVAVPKLRVGNPDHNKEAIFTVAKKANKSGASVILFPELSLSTYSCGDLFHNSKLLSTCEEALLNLSFLTSSLSSILVVGVPLRHNNAIYNCAAVLNRGEILGIIPKSFLPNYREFYEQRWFSSGKDIKNDKIIIGDKTIDFGTNLLFTDNRELTFAIEICEDLWLPVPPSSHHALAGANLVLNLSASNEIIGKSDYRRDLVKHQSARCICAYTLCSAGVYESSSDTVFGGHCLIFENGSKLIENDRFEIQDYIGYADIDCQKLNYIRLSESSFNQEKLENYKCIQLRKSPRLKNINRIFDPHPFVPSDKNSLHERCDEILNIQSHGLARRIEHIKAEKALIGLSGGLDSTLALLATSKAFEILKKSKKNIIAVTMPGFGTSNRTFKNAVSLAKNLGTSLKTINISIACENHLKDIGKDLNSHDITFENAQARERTQILMDLANSENGIVVGTADMSEIALGWSTYNGDHMSMYAINAGIPKTLVRHIIKCLAEKYPSNIRQILLDILAMPISPELLPSLDSDKIYQETEKIIGPYDLHDFFLYHSIKYGASPEKLEYIAKIAFKGIFAESVIRRTLKIFIKRFFSNQFKRNASPDGPKVGTIALSQRADWRMPSDADPFIWLNF